MNKFLQKLDTLGLLLLLAAVLYYSVANVWNKWALGLAIAGALLVAIGVGTNYKQILNTLGKRSAKYAGNYVVSVILVIALVAGLNYLGQRHPKRFDLTAIGSYTLAPQTTQILNKLNKDLTVKAFFPGGDYAALRELLTEYQAKSGHVKVEFVDPDKHPEEAKQYDVTTYGTFANPLTGSSMKYGTAVLLYGDRREKIEKRSAEIGEEDLTNAIIKIQNTEVKKIYFIEGHGERDIANAEKIGFSVPKKSLEEQGYQVAGINLATEGKIPQDAKVLIEAGPENEPFPQELQLINDFLNKGGNLLALLNAPPSPSLESFLKEWGIQVDNDIVLDVSGIGQLMNTGPSVALVSKYEEHRITNKFNAMTFFPLARSIQPSNTPVNGITVETLFRSSSNSWGKTNIKKLQGEVQVGEKDDLKGPLSLAVAATKEVKASTDSASAVKARLVVVGNSGFAVNGNFSVGGNGNLFLNMVSWLAQDEDLISIRAKTPTDRRMILSQSQLSVLRLISIFLIPGAVLFIGIAVWTRRRR